MSNMLVIYRDSRKSTNILFDNLIVYICIDPRTADWFMVPSVKQAATICALYVVYVQIGKHLMSFKKEPFQINNILIGYNLLMVLLSGYMVYEVNSWVSLQTLLN